MGSSSKRGGSAAQPQSMYGGSAMPQAQAQAQYQTDLANWRAPTTSATMTPFIQKNPVPTTPMMPGSDGGPPLPGVGVPIAAPVAIQQRNTLADLLRRQQPYRGGRGGERGSGGGGSTQGGPGGFGGSSARSGGLY